MHKIQQHSKLTWYTQPSTLQHYVPKYSASSSPLPQWILRSHVGGEGADSYGANRGAQSRLLPSLQRVGWRPVGCERRIRMGWEEARRWDWEVPCIARRLTVRLDYWVSDGERCWLSDTSSRRGKGRKKGTDLVPDSLKKAINDSGVHPWWRALHPNLDRVEPTTHIRRISRR